MDNGTFLERLTRRAGTPSGRTAVRFVKDGSGEVESLSREDLLGLARRGLAALSEAGARPGDRVLLALPTGESLVAGVLGAFLGGMVPSVVPVPMSRTSPEAFDSEWRALIALSVPAVVVADARLPEIPVPRVDPGDLLSAPESPLPEDAFSNPDRIAYVQFTSGSTGRPKGVALTWSGIQANVEAMVSRLGLTPEDHVVSWLPLYHDMGFFGTFLLPLHAGFPATLMDPSLFVANPLLWFRVMAASEATVTATPPSALKTALDLLRRRPISHCDLSTVAQFIVGAEPIPPRMLGEFRETLAEYGVSRNAMRPVYGMAEATLGVTMPRREIAPRVDWISKDRFENDHRAELSEEEGFGWVSVGSPLDNMRVVVVSEEGAPLPERQVGCIHLQSPALTPATLQEGVLDSRQGEWMDTGDLGYFADGELFVTGRSKDIIIKRGRNYAPERLEDLAALVEGVSRAAAFGIYDEAAFTEKIVLLTEVRGKYRVDAASRDRVRLAVRAALRSGSYDVDEVHLVPSGLLPRTTSGKIRRRECRERFLREEFAVNFHGPTGKEGSP